MLETLCLVRQFEGRTDGQKGWQILERETTGAGAAAAGGAVTILKKCENPNKRKIPESARETVAPRRTI